MAEHVTEWLGAYQDGELRGARRRQVEHHLAECAECRAARDELQALAALLHAPAPAGDFLPTERFIANLSLNLPRPTEARSRPSRWLALGWWLMPVGLLGAWLFIQITWTLSDAVSFAAEAGGFAGNLAWLPSGGPQMEWFAAALDLVGDQVGAPGRAALAALNTVHLLVTQALGPYVWQALFAVLYLGWLFAWWLRQPRQPSPTGEGFPPA